jgi:glycerate 2-kinase
VSARPPIPAAPVLVAPDSFKGTFSAAEVGAALARGLRAGGLDAEELPVADGGDGTLDVLVCALGGELRVAIVSDPLGRPVEAVWALLPSARTAVIEMARASGLALLAATERDAWAASSRGTGELVSAAAEAGARRVVLAVGGSASTDGGAGALAALAELETDPALELVLACDVRTTWEDAARLFAPQKGADAATVERLEERLGELAARAPRDPRGVPMTGAGGGLAGGLWAHRAARLVPGAAYVLDAIDFDGKMRGARFAVTGEGRLDPQTLAGKAAGEVATRCRQAGIGCHAVVGESRLSAFEARRLDLASVIEAPTLARVEAAGRELSATTEAAIRG